MKLYLLQPEVAGELGENTTILDDTYQNGVEKISHLHYEFYGWLGDELLESTPCFIVTEELAHAILTSPLKGYLLDEVEITLSDEFKELYPNETLPNFKRLIPLGKVFVEENNYLDWLQEDFCLSQNLYLVVSTTAFEVLKKHQLNYCDVFELNKD
ncbi:hypothetical protein V7139_17015 [Neobacillus drentensis]|uniref:hypothetical protein n=1 Tax=Neobacillus drentensis TaxID=220684 RepID=UPI002FFFD61D